MGYMVLEADDAPGGLAQFASFVPDILLVHIGLKSMDGYEVACRVRAMPGGEAAFIVAVTDAAAQENDRRRAREAGFDGHLTRPVTRDALVSVLDALPKHEMQS